MKNNNKKSQIEDEGSTCTSTLIQRLQFSVAKKNRWNGVKSICDVKFLFKNKCVSYNRFPTKQSLNTAYQLQFV